MLSQFVFVLTMRFKQAISAFGPHEISVLIELISGHLRYHLTDVPLQLNSPPDCVFCTNQSSIETILNQKPAVMQVSVQRNE